MKPLDRKALLAAKVEVPTETVPVPELGGSVLVRGLTGREQTLLYKAAGKKGGAVDEETFTARLISACLVDSSGNRLLEDDEWELVYQKFTQSFNRVAQSALRVNGLGADQGN